MSWRSCLLLSFVLVSFQLVFYPMNSECIAMVWFIECRGVGRGGLVHVLARRYLRFSVAGVCLGAFASEFLSWTFCLFFLHSKLSKH